MESFTHQDNNVDHTLQTDSLPGPEDLPLTQPVYKRIVPWGIALNVGKPDAITMSVHQGSRSCVGHQRA
ncbi:hypothetical protein OKW46_001935 [Paraburkholderia sp. WSM4179]|nr:hypothetical protein [Paraburkholderia sp. WSM4179]